MYAKCRSGTATPASLARVPTIATLGSCNPVFHGPPGGQGRKKSRRHAEWESDLEGETSRARRTPCSRAFQPVSGHSCSAGLWRHLLVYVGTMVKQGHRARHSFSGWRPKQLPQCGLCSCQGTPLPRGREWFPATTKAAHCPHPKGMDPSFLLAWRGLVFAHLSREHGPHGQMHFPS